MKQSLEEMLYLSHPKNFRHPPMPRPQRAAQFTAFAALTGFDEQLDHMERRVNDYYNDPFR